MGRKREETRRTISGKGNASRAVMLREHLHSQIPKHFSEWAH